MKLGVRFHTRSSENDRPSRLYIVIGLVTAAAGLAELGRVSATIPVESASTELGTAYGEEQDELSRLSEAPVEWAPVFGVPVFPHPFDQIEDEAPRVASIPQAAFVQPSYRLRGIIHDSARSLAFLEGENGTEVVGVGGELLDGWKLMEIRADGVLIEKFESLALVAFSDSVSADQTASSNATFNQTETASRLILETGQRELQRQFRTAYSRHPGLHPPRFFSMRN